MLGSCSVKTESSGHGDQSVLSLHTQASYIRTLIVTYVDRLIDLNKTFWDNIDNVFSRKNPFFIVNFYVKNCNNPLVELLFLSTKVLNSVSKLVLLP